MALAVDEALALRLAADDQRAHAEAVARAKGKGGGGLRPDERYATDADYDD